MYTAPAYGYGPGSLSAPFNPNGMPPQPHSNPHHHHQQPGLQQQQQQQQPQHLMFNPQQQYGGVVAHQSPYGTPSPGMGGNAGAMGVMQNTGMAPMAGGHAAAVPTYQTPYSSSPYGGSIPASTASILPPNFMPTTNAQSFNMNATNMNLQHPAQRMQPPPTSSTPQPVQRGGPFAGGQHNTPPNASTAASQFSTPQAPNQANLQTSNTNPQAQAQPGTLLTPQTPTFPQGSQGANALSTPLSPGSEVREKERVTLLLEINRELLMEVMRLNAQNTQTEVKKDDTAAASPDGSEKDKAEKEKVEKAKQPASREYFECMRRLQSNLAYLAAIADRSHKPSSQIPAHPAIMSAPPFPPRPPQSASNATTSPTADSKKEESDDKKTLDLGSLDEDRSETLKDQYKRLQALFPGVDPKKEPTNQAARAQAQAAAMQAQKQAAGGGGGPSAVDMNAQQKLQNDLLRQKMMQAQQAQQQQMAQASQMQQQQNR